MSLLTDTPQTNLFVVCLKTRRMATDGVTDTPSVFGARMRGARFSGKQFNALIQFMRKHPTLALGRAAGGSYCKEEHDFLWHSLSTQLNSTEGTIKSISKWQKCWVDLKSNARSRAAKLQASSHIDGVLPAGSTFTKWDEQVLKLLKEINPNESIQIPGTSPMSLSQLVEVPLTTGKVVLMEVNGGQPRTNRSNFVSISSRSSNHYHSNHIARKQNIKIEEPDADNYDFLEEGHDVEEEEEEENNSSEPIYDMLEEEEFSPSNEAHLSTRENDFVVRHTFPHAQNLDSEVNPLSGCSPLRCELPSSIHKEGENIFSRPCSSKRKRSASSQPNDVENSLDIFSKKICGALERVATAAEESNALQRSMVGAMDRLSSCLEQLLPLLVNQVSKNSSSCQ